MFNLGVNCAGIRTVIKFEYVYSKSQILVNEDQKQMSHAMQYWAGIEVSSYIFARS